MMSPWLTATQTAPGPCSASTAASRRRTAATARACIAAIDSPPGNAAADGWVCTVFQSFSLASSLSARPCHVAVVALGDAALGRGHRRARLRLDDGPGGLPAPLQRAGDDARRAGRPASRSAVRAGLGDARRRRGGRPRVRPASTPDGVGGGAAVAHEDHGCHAGERSGDYRRAP